MEYLLCLPFIRKWSEKEDIDLVYYLFRTDQNADGKIKARVEGGFYAFTGDRRMLEKAKKNVAYTWWDFNGFSRRH